MPAAPTAAQTGGGGCGLNKELINAHINLIWNPVPFADVGIEYTYGHRMVRQQPEGRHERADRPLPRAILTVSVCQQRQPAGPRSAGVYHGTSWTPPMIEVIKELPDNVVGIVAKGRVTNEECDNILKPAMERSLKRHGKIRLYYEVGSRFPGAGWDDLDVAIDHLPQWERIAIVTDTGWVRQRSTRCVF